MSGRVLIQSHAFVRIPLRHVGENDLLPNLQPFPYFDSAYRTAAETDGDPDRFSAVFYDFE